MKEICVGIGLGLFLFTCAKKDQVSAPRASELRDQEDKSSENNNDELQIGFIAESINGMSSSIRECYARATAVDKNVTGKIVLMATVRENGAATIEVADDDIKNSSLKDCVMAPWKEKTWPSYFANGDVVQLPPLSFVAAEEQYVAAGSYIDFNESKENPGVSQKVLLSKLNTGNQSDFKLVLSEIKSGNPFGHRQGMRRIDVVLAGAGTAKTNSKKIQVAPGDMVRAKVWKTSYTTQDKENPLKVLSLEKTTTKETPKLKIHYSTNTDLGAQWYNTKTSELKEYKLELGLTAEPWVDVVGFVSGGANTKSPVTELTQSTHVYYLTHGTATFEIDGVKWLAQVGEAVQIPSGKSYVVNVGRAGLKAVFFEITD